MAEKTKKIEARLASDLVEISCPSGPRRRAGLSLGPTPLTMRVDELTDAQREAIQADAMLVIRPGTKAGAEPEPAA